MPSSAPVDVRHKLPPLKSLTAVRFFAAAYVVMFHDKFQESVTGIPVLVRFLDSGYTAVTLFFVLSGFILAYNYPAVKSAKSFWIARFARVYPVYLLATVFLFAIALPYPQIRNDPGFYVGTGVVLLLMQAWWPMYSLALNEPAWTLSVEAFFYALFPILIGPFSRMKRRTFIGLQVVYSVFVLLPWLMQMSPRWAASGAQLGTLIEGTIPVFRLNTFVVGVYLGAGWARLVRRRMAADGDALRSDGRWRVCLWVGLLSSLVLLCTAPPATLLSLRTLVLTYTFGMLLLGLAGTNWRALTNHPMQVLGEISYGIYILQAPVFHIALATERRVFPHLEHPTLMRTSIEQMMILLPLSYVIFRWVEIPARLVIRRVLTGKPVPTRPV